MAGGPQVGGARGVAEDAAAFCAGDKAPGCVPTASAKIFGQPAAMRLEHGIDQSMDLLQAQLGGQMGVEHGGVIYMRAIAGQCRLHGERLSRSAPGRPSDARLLRSGAHGPKRPLRSGAHKRTPADSSGHATRQAPGG